MINKLRQEDVHALEWHNDDKALPYNCVACYCSTYLIKKKPSQSSKVSLLLSKLKPNMSMTHILQIVTYGSSDTSLHCLDIVTRPLYNELNREHNFPLN